MDNFLITFALLVAAPSAAKATDLAGLWLTNDKESVVSIGACTKNKEKYCGFLTRFRDTGNKELNRKLCGSKLVGDMSIFGNRLTGGWIYSPEKSQAYNLIIYPKTAPEKILLRAYGNKVSDGESFTWTRYHQSKDGRAASYWAKCAIRSPG